MSHSVIEQPAPDGRTMLRVSTREELRAWLEINHTRPTGVWFVSSRPRTDLPRIEYEDLIEELLCFGWIDSTARTLDEQHRMLWISPRRPRSVWAKTNKARVERLEAAGRMRDAGRRVIERAKADGSWEALTDVENEVIPADLAEAFARHAGSAENFAAFSPSSRKMILGWIAQAKRSETRARRIEETARRAAAGEKAF